MSEKINRFDINYGIQVIFTSTPNDKKIDFEKNIEKEYFTKFREIYGSEDDFLYKPLKFYVLGDYDVCYITLINNFKFSHRVFENLENEGNVNNNHTFQSYSGFSLNDKNTLEDIFSKGVSEKYVGIYNLKLNNALLYGNGLDFISAIKAHLEEILNVRFILTQTFSWFELSLVFFTNDIGDFDEILKNIRKSTFISLKDSKLLTNSLYHKLEIADDKIDQASLVSDTVSYFGFNKDLINKETRDRSSFKIEIEWHVKPGHLTHLHKLLPTNNVGRVIFGRSDYIVQESNIATVILLIKDIRSNPKKYFDHIRKVRSFAYFDYKKTNEEDREVINLEKQLNKIAFKQEEILKLKKDLKKLLISRTLRNKVIKAFTNFNHGVVDPILFPFFLDFKVFLSNILSFVNENIDEERLITIDFLEKHLTKSMSIFKESFQMRFLNGYLFENMSTFSIDFNSSIQLLLMSYNTVIYEYGKSFFKDDRFYPMILLNERDTISNYYSINYSVHHLTSPEFVFSTINKELINNIKYEKKNMKYLVNKNEENNLGFNEKEINNFIKQAVSEINESYLDDLLDHGLFDIHYLIADVIRFVVNYGMDFSLFYYWFWTYNFQNAALYNKSGMINEDRLRMELLRVWLIKEIFQVNKNIDGVLFNDFLLCPVPELQSYWDRHQEKISKVSKEIYEYIFEKERNLITDHIHDIFKLTFIEYLEQNNAKGKKDIPVVMDKNEYWLYLNRKDKITNISNESKSYEVLQSLFTNSLKEMKDLNNGVIKTVKRNWHDGTILDEYLSCYDDVCYTIDAFGGMFFKNTDKTNEYFKFNSKIIIKILDFSYKKKLDFMLKKIEDNG